MGNVPAVSDMRLYCRRRRWVEPEIEHLCRSIVSQFCCHWKMRSSTTIHTLLRVIVVAVHIETGQHISVEALVAGMLVIVSWMKSSDCGFLASLARHHQLSSKTTSHTRPLPLETPCEKAATEECTLILCHYRPLEMACGDRCLPSIGKTSAGSTMKVLICMLARGKLAMFPLIVPHTRREGQCTCGFSSEGQPFVCSQSLSMSNRDPAARGDSAKDSRVTSSYWS